MLCINAGSGSGIRQDGQCKEEEDTARPSQSHMAAWEPFATHRSKLKKCRALQISEESAQEVDVYNLQSPGLVLLDQNLVSMTQQNPNAASCVCCAACG